MMGAGVKGSKILGSYQNNLTARWPTAYWKGSTLDPDPAIVCGMLLALLSGWVYPTRAALAMSCQTATALMFTDQYMFTDGTKLSERRHLRGL
jgi:hypothetical protein